METNLPIYGSTLWVKQVIAEVFGIQSPIQIIGGLLNENYKISTNNADKQIYQFQNNIALKDDIYANSEISQLGTPVLGVVKFEGGDYNVFNKYSSKVEKATYLAYTLPYSVLIDFSRENNVILTKTLGGGTVKEIFGVGDWKINIRGIAVNGGDKVGNSAHKQIDALIKWADICDAIECSGTLFDSKQIRRLVIQNFEIQPIEAKYNVIPFQIEAISDDPLELIL